MARLHRTQRGLLRDAPLLSSDQRSRGGGRYGDDVITPYTPFNLRFSNGDSPKRFRRGIYAIRIRTVAIGAC